MSEDENFLARWSRRKLEAEQPQPAAPDATQQSQAAQNNGQAGAQATAPEKANEKPALEFDIAKLPPLESITAQTDIQMFLRPGVPAELSRAALRRAWSADPAIRDFIGLAENQWDFTAPNTIAGFGALGPDVDVAKLVADVFGHVTEPAAQPDAKPENVEAAQPSSELERASPPAELAADQPASAEAARTTALPPADIASQQKEPTGGNPSGQKFPCHGGAVPKNISRS